MDSRIRWLRAAAAALLLAALFLLVDGALLRERGGGAGRAKARRDEAVASPETPGSGTPQSGAGPAPSRPPEPESPPDPAAAVCLRFDLRQARTGESVPGAIVILSGRFPSEWRPDEGLRFETTRGVLADARMRVTARAPGFVTREAPLASLLREAEDSGRELLVPMSMEAAEGNVLRLRAVDGATGAPIAGAAAVLAPRWRERTSREPAAVAGSDGVLAVDLALDHGGPLVVTAAGYLSRRLPGATEATDAGDFPLLRDDLRATLTVRVTGRDPSEPWSGRLALARRGPDPASREFQDLIARLDPATKAALASGSDPERGLPLAEPLPSALPGGRWTLWPGDYAVIFTDDGGCASATLALAPGESRELLLEPGPGCLVLPADALGGATLILRRPDFRAFSWSTDGPGIPMVPAGSYETRLRLPFGGVIRGEEVEVPAVGQTVVALPSTVGTTAILVGRLVDESGAPIVGISIGCADATPVVTDAEGGFRIGPVAAQPLNLVAPGYRFPGGRASLRVEKLAASGSPRDLGTIRLERAAPAPPKER